MSEKSDSIKAVRKAISIVGSQSELARRCGVAPTSTHRWVNGGRVSASYAILIEKATDRQVKRSDILPAIFGEDS